ncbi:MAG TPA: hypothetical protein VEL76_17685 [Gemmataceae bacterium]|nr:hypothetical protein [Gemmataceae bacterium]
MCKKVVVIGLLAVGALYAYKKTDLGIYLRSWCNRNCPNLELSSRTDKIEDVKREIDGLDEKLRGLLGPIADKQERAEQLEKEINTARAKFEQRRDSLRELIQGVEAGSESILFEGKQLTLAAAKARRAREEAAVRQLKAHEEELAALQKILRADLEQLDNIALLKQQLRTHIAKLEAQEQTLQVKQAPAPAGVNQDWVRNIQRKLDRIEQAQKKEGRKLALEERYLQPASETSTAQPGDRSLLKDLVGPQPAQPKVAGGN